MVSWVLYRDSCRLDPLLPKGDRRGDTGRDESGRMSWGVVSDTKVSASTVRDVDARKGSRWATRLDDCLEMTGLLVSGGGLRFMAASVERLRGSMAIVK